jgi:polysaccharide deacetylase family protein (PEP-CTERM system associated)
MHPTKVRNALTIDFEDWYQGLEIPSNGWQGLESRIQGSGKQVLDLLAGAGVCGTFFVLGCVAREHPDIVKSVRAAGHEIGTHGHTHEFVYRLMPNQFRDQLKKSIATLEDLTGSRVIGHRAPFFSITKECLWALDILGELGILYDSSIFPVLNYRYGIEDAPRWPCDISANGGTLKEFPISTLSLFGRNVPVAGGAYFRIYPYWVTRRALLSINRQGRPFTFYLHPWEIDPEHPRIPLPRRVAITHYFNLNATEGRFRSLLRDFVFVPMREVLNVD